MKNKIRILLVEDQCAIGERFIRMLNAIEFIDSVDWVSNCEEAVSIYSQINPQIILIDDLVADGMTGFEAARWIKEQDDKTKIIITSSRIRKQYVSAALRCNVEGYVRKDIDSTMLYSALRTVTTGGWYYTEALMDLTLTHLYSNLNSAKSDTINLVENLSTEEEAVLKLIAIGKSIQEIAGFLALGNENIESIRKKILEKIGIESVVDLKRFALKSNLIAEKGLC